MKDHSITSIMKHFMVLAMMLLSALGIQAQRVLMNINKTDGTTLSINTEEVECVTFEEKYASATIYYGCTDDIPTSITEQGTAVDIYGDEDEVNFYAEGKCVWVALPKYWKVAGMRVQTGENKFGFVGYQTIQVGGYIVYYAIRGDGGSFEHNFSPIVQKFDTPVTPSSVLIFYGSSSTIPDTLTPEGYKTVQVSENSGSVTFPINNHAYWIAVPNGWIVDEIKETSFGTDYMTSANTKSVEGYTMYYDSDPFINTASIKVAFSKQ